MSSGQPGRLGRIGQRGRVGTLGLDTTFPYQHYQTLHNQAYIDYLARININYDNVCANGDIDAYHREHTYAAEAYDSRCQRLDTCYTRQTAPDLT